MIRSQHFVLPFLAAVAAIAAPEVALAGDGDWIVRLAAGYVVPTAEATYRGSETIDFSDPRFPPVGTFDLLREDHVSARGDLGLGLELEHMLTDTVGLTASASHTSLVGETVLSGEATFTPSVGEPPTLAPERAHTTPVTGGGAGRVRLTTLTVGARFHVAGGDRVDVSLGPLVGLAVPAVEYTHGSMLLIFGFRSLTPLEGTEVSQARLALGGVVGVDVPLGGGGWRLSVAARYLWTNGLNPATIELGLGYGF